MADYVAQATYKLDDQVSAGAKAATDALNKLADAGDKASKSTDQVQKTTERIGPSFDTVNRRIDENAKLTTQLDQINRRFQQSLSAVRAEYDAGGISASQLAEKESRLSTLRDNQIATARKQADALASVFGTQAESAGKATAASNQLAFAQRQLGVQAIQAFSGIATGQPILTTLIQQGHQVADVSISTGTGFAALGSAFRALVSPIGLAVGAFAALGAAAYVVGSRSIEIQDQQKKLGEAIKLTGNTATASVSDLQNYIDRLRDMGTASDDAAKAATQLARAQGLSQAGRSAVEQLTPDLAAALGTNTLDAQQQAIGLAQGQWDAIKKLDEALNFLNADQFANIKTLIEHGKQTEAVSQAFVLLRDRIKDAHDNALTPTASAFEHLGASWNSFVDSVAKSQPVMALVQGWANVLSSLAHAVGGQGSSTVAQLGNLNEQITKLEALKRQYASEGTNAPDVEKSLATLNAQRNALIGQMQGTAVTAAAKSAASSDPTLGQNLMVPTDQKSIFDRAASIAAGSPTGRVKELTEQNKQFSAALDQMGGRTEQNATRFDTLTLAIKTNNKAIADASKVTEVHRTGLQKAGDTLDAQIKAQNDLTTAYASGYDAVAKIVAVQDAEKKAISDGLTPGTAKYSAAVADLTDKNLRLADAKAKTDIAKELRDIDTATDAQLAINAAYDGTEASLSHAQNAQKAYVELLQKGLNPATEDFKTKQDALTDALDRGTAASRAFAQQQSSVQALSNAFSQAFSTIGDAITQAFVSGQGAAVSFGNVAKAVVTQLIQQFSALAIINPIRNAVFGENNGTLSTALDVLGRQGSSGSSGSLLSTGGNLLSLGGLADSLGLTNIGGQFSGLTNSLGLTGAGNIFGGLGSSVSGILNTPLISGLSAGQFGPVTSGLAAGGAGLPAGLTVGSLLGGAGAGFGVGSLLNSLAGGHSLGGTVGSGLGGLAGAAIGSIIPGIGTLIGGILGGGAGGLFGGVFGPGKANAYSSTGVGVSNGQLSIGRTLSQLVDTSAETAALRSQVSDISQFLSAYGIQVAGQRGTIQIGQNTPGGYVDPTKYSDLYTANSTGSTAFSQFRFGNSPNSGINKLLDDKSFSSLTDLENTVNKFNDTMSAVDNFLGQTVPALTNTGKVTGSFNDQMAALASQFDSAKAQADALIASGYLSDDQTAKLIQAENDLADARDRATKLTIEQINAQTSQTDIGLTSRYLNAAAQISGSPQDALNASLYAFDANADQQRKQLSDQLTSIWGDSFKASSAYADQMAILEHTLGEERLAIQKQYGDQIAAAAQQQADASAQAAQAAAQAAQQQQALIDQASQNAAGVIGNLSQYVQGLKVGSNSPLSPLDQYSLSRSELDKMVASAANGNFSSLSQVQSYADSFLSASRAVNGSGIAYANDFSKVVDALSTLTNVSTDALTNASFVSETRTQTQVLSDAIAELKAELVSLRQQVAQNNSAPARISA